MDLIYRNYTNLIDVVMDLQRFAEAGTNTNTTTNPVPHKSVAVGENSVGTMVDGERVPSANTQAVEVGDKLTYTVAWANNAIDENTRVVSVEEGYGGPDETTDILDQLGTEIYIGDQITWYPFRVIDEELP